MNVLERVVVCDHSEAAPLQVVAPSLERVDDRKQLALVRRVVPLGGRELARLERNRVPNAGDLLRQVGADGDVARVGRDADGRAVVVRLQDGRRCENALERFKGLLCFWGPCKLALAAGERRERRGEAGETLDEFALVRGEAEEAERTSVVFEGTFHSLIALIFCGSTFMPSAKTMWPRKSIEGRKNAHLDCLANSLWRRSRSRTARTCAA